MSSENLVDVFAVEEVQGELETLSYERGEEEEAEGDDFEDQQLLRHVSARVAAGSELEAVLSWSGYGETYEDGDGEERVHVDESVESAYVDTCCGVGGSCR